MSTMHASKLRPQLLQSPDSYWRFQGLSEVPTRWQVLFARLWPLLMIVLGRTSAALREYPLVFAFVAGWLLHRMSCQSSGNSAGA